MLQKWKRVTSKIILDHPRIKVWEDEVELPNGKVTDYVRFGSGFRGAAVICRNDNGQILLQKEYSYPPDEFLFQFPGGAVFEGEDPIMAANRELMEEAKLRANKLELLGTYLPNCRRSDSLAYVYLGTDLVEESRQEDEEEVIESYWFSEVEIEEMIRKGEITNITVLANWVLYKTYGHK
jgi:8-oxo-dGTP pyrophosphatase MutT (NUDIX family)